MTASKRLQILGGHINPRTHEDEGEGRAEPSRPTEQLLVNLTKSPIDAFPQATASSTAFPQCKSDWFQLDDLLSPEAREVRARVRSFMEKEVSPTIASFWEKAEFPHHLRPKLGALGIGGCGITGHGCNAWTLEQECVAMMEVARVDASLALGWLVHDSLCMYTIASMGTEDQKAKYLPKLATFEYMGCWALTEPNWGSDAASIETTAEKVPGGWKLNGHKRWIGNSTFGDVCCLFARNLEDGNVNAFVLEPKTQAGWAVEKMENKTAMRVTQNGDITLTDAVVPESARLPGVTTFAATTSALAASRVVVAWQPLGIAMGIYDMCHRYLLERKQFGAPLAAQQLHQERLMRMLGSIQAMALMAWRITRLAMDGKSTAGKAGMAKAWNTMRGREVAALGREMLGGNGIVHDFHVAKAFADMEAVHTYEGTYDVNMLVAAREMTGIASFKPRNK